MQSIAETIYEQVQVLPDYAAREVLDFVAFLQSRLDRQQDVDLANAQAESMRSVWDNQDDEVWNDV